MLFYKLPAAQRHLGECYANGIGVEKSQEKAIHYYTLAADQGDLDSQYTLAKKLLDNNQSLQKAIHYLKKVERNVYATKILRALAAYEIAIWYEKGIKKAF